MSYALQTLWHERQRYVSGVCQWAESKGVRKLYCITEYRPLAVDRSHVLNSSYFTVRGA